MPSFDAVIVAHGQPGDPDPQEDALKALAEKVAVHLPKAQVRGATLAKQSALEAAVRGLEAPLIYPFFMAEGYFTGRALPARLSAIGEGFRQLAPFGVDPALTTLISRVARAAAGDAEAETTLILAAHGSKVSATSKDSAGAMAGKLAQVTGFRRIVVGLIEEPPFLADVAAEAGRGICLPFFALRAGHVTGDIPEALEQAGFAGTLLPAIGEHEEVPALIAEALSAAQTSGSYQR